MVSLRSSVPFGSNFRASLFQVFSQRGAPIDSASLGVGWRSWQHRDLAHDCTRIVEIDAARYFAVAHVDNADASDRELLSRVEHSLIRTAKDPFDGSVAALDIGT